MPSILPGVQRRTIERGANDLVGAFGSVRDPAADLARMIGRRAGKRKHRSRVVAGLFSQHAEIDRAAVDARRRSGLQPVDAEFEFAQTLGQPLCRRIAGASARVVGEADMDLAGQERARGQHDRRGAKAQDPSG
jgi:hypothetical protein